MQVERWNPSGWISGGRVSNTWVTCLKEGNSLPKGRLIPHNMFWSHDLNIKGIFRNSTLRWTRGALASWWGKGPPRQRCVADLRGWSATLELRHGPDSYGRQQWGILRNGGNPDAATPREWWRPSGCKVLSSGTIMTVPEEEATANYVPAAAVIRRWQALSGFTGRKGCVGGHLSQMWNTRA
jgi:hypothetical protein